MNKTAALKQARAETSLYRQGSGWVLAVWREDVGAWETSPEAPHANARQVRMDWIKRRVEELVGEAS